MLAKLHTLINCYCLQFYPRVKSSLAAVRTQYGHVSTLKPSVNTSAVSGRRCCYDCYAATRALSALCCLQCKGGSATVSGWGCCYEGYAAVLYLQHWAETVIGVGAAAGLYMDMEARGLLLQPRNTPVTVVTGTQIMPQASGLRPHAPCLIPHASYLTPKPS